MAEVHNKIPFDFSDVDMIRKAGFRTKDYAELEVCKAIIVVSTVSFGLPLAINGKPSYNVQLGKSWL